MCILNIIQEVNILYGFVAPYPLAFELNNYINWGILTDAVCYKINETDVLYFFYKLNQDAKDYANKMLAAGYSEKDIENEFSKLKFKKA